METKHTPGPWNANWTRISGQAVGFHIADSKHGSLRPICESYDKAGATRADEIEANARLIAASPKLLAALKSLCEIQKYGDVAGWRQEWDDAKEAIEEAEGS